MKLIQTIHKKVLAVSLVALAMFIGIVAMVNVPTSASDSCSPTGTTYGTDTMSISVSTAATYTIWTRMQIPSSSDNSILLKVDGTNCYNIGANSSLPTSTWEWVDYSDGSSANAISLSLNAGTHTLEFVGTYQGVEVDRVLAVPGGDCTPTGTGNDCTQTSPPSVPTGVTATANSSTSVTVNWSAATDSGGSGLGGYYILRGGTQVGSVGGSTTSYTDTTTSANTQYNYTVEAYDTIGNISSASSAATVTTPSSSAQAPTVGLNSFPNDTSVKGSAYSLNASVSPVSGNTISQAQLLVNNVVIQTLTSAPYTFTLNTLNYKDGSYTVTVKATDNQGNVGQSTTTAVVTNGDLNGDGKVSISDLAVMAAHWGQTDSNYADGNITGQSTINISDLAVLASNWGWSG